MPNRIIKESIWTSPNLNRLSWEAERHFYRIMPCPDDHGCCECSPAVIKGKCYPLQDNVTVKHIEQWQSELEKEKLISWSQIGVIRRVNAWKIQFQYSNAPYLAD